MYISSAGGTRVRGAMPLQILVDQITTCLPLPPNFQTFRRLWLCISYEKEKGIDGCVLFNSNTHNKFDSVYFSCTRKMYDKEIPHGQEIT